MGIALFSGIAKYQQTGNYSLFYAFNNSIGKCNIYSIIKSRQFKIIIYLYIQSYKNIF